MYLNSGDLDERLFIDQIEQIGTPSKVTSQTANYYHLRSKSTSTAMEQPVTLFDILVHFPATLCLSVPKCRPCFGS